MRPRSFRWSAWLVLVSIVGNQVLFAYEPERSYWEQRRQAKAKRSADSSGPLLARGPLLGSGGDGRAVLPVLEKVSAGAHYKSMVSLPPGLGEPFRPYFSAVPQAHATIRKIHLPKNGKPRGLVFHVLDVHRNLDAQTNIAHTVTSLIGLPPSSAIAMVGLEGAFRPYDLSWLRSFPDPRDIRVAAEDLLAQDKMSGPMFSLLTAPTAIPPVIGIDDEPHYQANLSAYRRSVATKEADHAQVKIRVKQLESDKTAAFNPELKSFDETVQGYYRGTTSLGTYARALARKGGPPLAKPIALFLEALEKEETLDFEKVEQQRAGLVESLAQKMNPTQTNELVSRSVSYRAGHLTYGDFYRWIGALCEDVGVPLSQFPAMAGYIRYVLLSETIDAEDLLAECRRREKILFEQLAKTDDERDLINQSRYMTLVEKLLDFSLTPDEWADYEQVRVRGGEGVNLEPYESFYRQAHARDSAMAENFLGALEKTAVYGTSTTPVSLIVTGGYHGPGLKEKLIQAGMAVVTVVPKIEKSDTTQGSSYLTVFAQEKTPLDKLFEGAKLFVADAPLPQTTAALQATGSALGSLTPGGSLTPKALAFLETHFKDVSVVWDKGIASIRLELFGEQFAVRYDPSQPMGKKIQAGQPSDINFIQKWLQSRFVDRRLLTIGAALLVAGVWLFIAGPTALHQMGPLVSAIGLLTILHNWIPGGRLVTQSTAVGRAPNLSNNSLVQMTSEPEKIGVTAMAVGGKVAPPSRQPGDPWMDLSDIPEGFLRGRTVIVRTNLDDTQISYDDMRLVLAAKTVRHLTKAGAKVVLLSHRGRPNGFDQNGTLNKRAEMLGVMVGQEINILSGDHGKSFRWLSDSDNKAIRALKNGEVVMLQNTRFDSRETSNDPTERQAMAQELVDLVPDALFVLDGFPIAHRFNTASSDGLAQLLPGVKGLWQSLEEAQHNEFLLRLDNPEQRGKLTVIFGGGKLDKQVEIEAFAREHLRRGDTLIVGGLFSEHLLDSGLTSELERRGATILLPDPSERKLKGNTYEDVGPTFTEKTIEAISNAQTVFWEGPLGRYRDPHSNSLRVAQAITRWAEDDPKRRAFISGGSTSFLFKEANGWDENKRAEARGITVSTGGGTSIFYFAHRGRLPGTEGLRGWEPKGHVDLNNYPNFWRDILKDPRTFGYVFVVDKNGNYEAHSRRILPGKYGSDLFNDVTQMLILQERVNVGFGSTVDASGVPVPGRFFVTEGHQDFVVFDKDGNPHLLGENENPADRLLNSETVLAAIQNPDRAKRSGSEPGKTRDAAEKDPEMRVLTAESILKKFPLEVFFVWKSKSGTEWWGTGNRAAYYSNDPNGNPLEQVDHVTFSSSVDGKSQSEIGSLETLRDLMDFSTVINSSNDLVGRPKFRLAGNSWYAKNKDKKGAEFKAGASQNVRHAHALRVIFPVEHAPRQMVGKVQNVDVSVLSDPDNGPGLVLEADFVHLGDLIQVAHRAIGNIVERGHAFNYIIVPTESGFRIFIGDKIQGVPDVRFKNESAFAELGRLMIIDPPELFYRLTPDQMAEIEKLAKEAEEQNKKLNLSPWVKKEKKAGRLEVVDPNLFQDSLAALRSVSAPAQEILKLAEWLVHSPGRSRGPPPSAQGGGTAKNKALSRKEDLAQRIGGKAHGLTILSEVPGVRVPAWDVLPVDVFDEFLRDNPSVGELISKLGSHQDESERGALLEKIRLQIEEAPISPKLLEKIAGLYKDVINRSGNSGARVSVRSSSPAEDQKTASFAGQYKTVLHIRGEEFVVKAVKEVWASTFSSDAVRYRVEQANGDVWAPMAVIIQVMVNARSAGTAFTVDLETGAPFYSINATYGAGESEVAGKVTPDRFIVDPGSLEIIKRRLGDKKEKISPPLPGQEGPRIETTSPEERIKFALESSEVRSIAEGLSAIKGHFEKVSGATSFDVEYAVDLDGNLFFLQCRPETVWSKNPPKRRAVEASRAPRIPATHMGGLTATPGVVRGTLRVISEVGEPGVRRAERLVQDGDILVVTHTTNIWERVLAKAGGVLTDTGGPGCHTAVIARESQKPAVVGTGTAVKTLSQFDGQRVTLDATNRIIYLGAVPEEAITEASVGTPQYGGLDSESEDVTWQEVLRSGTAIDRGDGQRWIGKPAYALTAFMSDVYSSGHQLMASLLEIPTRLDFADGIHLIHFSDLSRWREKLRSMNLEQLENMHQDRIRTSTDYLRLSKEFNPTLVDFRAWLQLYARLNSYIAVGYAFSRVTEGLMEEALKNKKLVEPYFSEVRTGMAGRVGETEATQFLRSYKGLLEDLKANEKLKLALMAVIETKSWEPLRGEDESFYRTFEQVAYKFKITPRTEPIVGLLEPFEVLARRLLQDAKENRQIFIPTHESEDFFPEDERFTRTVLLAVGSEKAREDAHHQKMRGLWMFRARMEPFTQWLIREGKIKEYEDVFSHPVKWVENELGVFEQKRKNLSLDSLLSRFFKVMEEGGESPVASKMWRVGRWVNDFVAAPIYETALFFLLPAMSGSVPILMIGLLIFVALHDWDDYQAGKSSGLSPPAAREKSMRRAVARFWRAMILYAMPFALFLVPSELIPLLEPFGFGSLLSLAQESSLFEIAGTVALLHSSRNFINTGYVVLKKKFPSLGSRKDTSLLVLLFGLPIVASASSLVENPSLPFLFLAALPWPTILGALGGVALVSGAVILSHVIFRSGGQASDEIEAIDHILGSGLPHRVTTPLLLHAATHTENEEVARLAVRPLIAPWRNLNVDLNQAKDRFTKRGWTSLAKEVSGEWNSDTKWLEALAGSDARHMADVVFLEEDPFVSGNQDASLKTLNEVFPAIGSLNVGTLGSPGLNQIHNIGLDIIKPEYETAFKENIRSFYSDLKVSDSGDVPPVPTVNQSLARLRKFVASEVKPGTDENKVPVQLEVYTLADIEIARETIQLLQRINEGEENPVRLLLAGVDHATVTALREAANGFANVAVAEFPVATQIEETGAWNLETSSLNNQFEGLKMFLGIGDDFALEVSLSETISVDKRTLESQDTEKFNEALKQALLRFILNEPRPFHFNTMLKIIQAIKQSA